MERFFCHKLLATIAPRDAAMFRFLLEAHDNLALFTTLEPDTALIKIMFPLDNKDQVVKVLEDIRRCLPIEWRDWPVRVENMASGQ